MRPGTICFTDFPFSSYIAFEQALYWCHQPSEPQRYIYLLTVIPSFLQHAAEQLHADYKANKTKIKNIGPYLGSLWTSSSYTVFLLIFLYPWLANDLSPFDSVLLSYDILKRLLGRIHTRPNDAERVLSLAQMTTAFRPRSFRETSFHSHSSVRILHLYCSVYSSPDGIDHCRIRPLANSTQITGRHVPAKIQ